MTQISVSILSCDHTRVAQVVQRAQAAGANAIHIDIMDGVYCKNLSFGPDMVAGIKRLTSLPVDVHLALWDIERMSQLFIDAGADSVTFQLDACPNPLYALRRIRGAGARAGVAIAPSYTVDRVSCLLEHVDMLNLMSVEPGYGGQMFEKSVFAKVADVRGIMDRAGLRVPLHVDGGIQPKTAQALVEAGADVLVVGRYLFTGDDLEARLGRIRAVCAGNARRLERTVSI